MNRSESLQLKTAWSNLDSGYSIFVCFIFYRYANLILNLFALMVDANVPDIALEPDKTVKKVPFSFILEHMSSLNCFSRSFRIFLSQKSLAK